jgi:hypothetical protein
MAFNKIMRHMEGRSRDIYGARGRGKTQINFLISIIAATADYELSRNNPTICRGRFIAPIADLSALGGCSDTQMNVLKLIIGPLSPITLKDGNPRLAGVMHHPRKKAASSMPRPAIRTLSPM